MYLEKELKEIIEIKSVSSNIEELNNCLKYCVDFVQAKNKDKIFINKKEFNGISSILFSNCDTMNFDVLSIGHIDVVPAKDELFAVKIEENKLYGRGSADMKSGVLIALDLLKDTIEKNIAIKYGVLVVSDEEVGGVNGAKKWAELGLNATVLLDYDCGDGFEYISQKSKGITIVELESKGIEAHGSMSWDGLDANDIIIDTINELRAKFKNFSIYNKPKDSWVPTMHVGKINGGDAMNKIASQSKATLDFRLTEQYKVQDVFNIINEIIDRKYKDLLSYKVIGYGEAVYSNSENKYFKKYKDILKKELNNKEPQLVTFNGATDMRYFVNDKNIVIHHNSNIGTIHSDNEYVDLTTLAKLKKVGLEFILNYKNIK